MLIRPASFLQQLTDPWIILADWNTPPSTWERTGWLRKLGAELILPANSDTTCNLGKGSLID
eukprot:3223451-Pyramimonas_sp.AAC.2